MLRYVAYLLLILLFGAVEGTLPRLLWTGGAYPLLLVPLVFFFAVRLPTMPGALLSWTAGFVQDSLGGWPTGLAAFTCVSLFLGTRLVLAGLRADGRLFDLCFCFGLAACYHALSLAVIRTLGPNPNPMEHSPWLTVALLSSLTTAILAPLVLGAARRLERMGAPASTL